MVSRVAAPVVALLVLAVLAPVVRAQERPRYGGELVFVVPAESPSFDAHRAESFRVDPDDPSGTRIVGDQAQSWSSARGGRTWTFILGRGVITPSHFLNNQLDTVWLAE